jgi:hypothetical protein
MKQLLIAMTLVAATASASAATTFNNTAATTSKSATDNTALSTTVINNAFAGTSWTELASLTAQRSTSQGSLNGTTSFANGVNLTWTITTPVTGSKTNAGTFSVTSNKAVTLDLAVAARGRNTNGGSSATNTEWLFDNFTLAANTKTNGTFSLDWITAYNNGGNINAFGAGLYARDVAVTVSPVPEPQSYAMMLAALGMVTLVARRKRS